MCAPQLRPNSWQSYGYDKDNYIRSTLSEGYLMVIEPRRDAHACKPGQLVPISGMYTVVHVAHRADHEVLAIRGEEFPACRVCNARVTFYPTQPVTHMTHDFDLAGPCLQMPRNRAKAPKRGVG